MGDVGIMGMHVSGMSWREMRDSAVLAEDLGYSCLSMGESWGEDALTSLAQLAAVTSRIRIGTSIVPVFARSPANLAMAALNLDRMSEGRFFLGLGTSGRLVIQDLHGERFDKPLTRMREYIDIIRKASRGEMLDHDGEFFHTKRFRLRIPPFRPGLPIYIAALSPASLRLTGEVADGWLPIFLAPSRMTAAATGTSPPPSAFATVNTSGVTPRPWNAKRSPVRPRPVWISSNTSKVPYRSQKERSAAR